MAGYRKKLIEVALPLDAINAESAREKSIRHGHPSTLHLWWARRPLAACRAVLFASLVDDPSEPAAPPAYLAALDALPKPDPLPLLWDSMTLTEQRRERLFSFISRLVKWENSNDERVIGTARELIQVACEGNLPPVWDPFCGGGSIPLEAQRLGLEAHASDLNPVAVLITKALIEIPPRFAGRPPVNPVDRAKLGGAGVWKGAAGIAADVRYYGNWMRDEAERRIGYLYPKARLPGGGEATVIAWLWARMVRCPNPACGARMPLVRSFALSTKATKQSWVEPRVDRSVTPPAVRFEVKSGAGKIPDGTVNRKGAICIACGVPVPLDHLRAEGKAGRMDADMMAMAVDGKRGRTYLPPDPVHADVAASATPLWKPDADLPHNPRDFKTPNYGMRTFASLFTSRQLVALTTFSDLVSEALEHAQRDAIASGLLDDGQSLTSNGTGVRAYGEAVAIYAAFALSKMADRGSTICTWFTERDSTRNTFARQAIPMTWDFAELNTLLGGTGSFVGAVGWTAESLDAVVELPTLTASVDQKDATSITGDRVALVSTDPPYYDNVGYADLSDFFYVWLRYSLQTVYPALFSTLLVPKSEELVASPYRFGGSRQRAEAFFREGLGRAFEAMRRVQGSDYPLTLYYAFKQVEAEAGDRDGAEATSTGWETMLTGLVDAGFTITGTWPMRSELGNRMVASGNNALASSIVLVCRRRPDHVPSASRAEFLDGLGAAMRESLPVLASGRVAPVDLAQASIGPGMAVYSKHGAVIRQDGRRVTVHEALQDINGAIATYRAERVSAFDPHTRFCLDWYQQHGFGDGLYGDADNLARAYNVGPEAMQRDGLLVTGQGRVRLERPSGYPCGVADIADRTFHGSAWEACLRLAATLEHEGEPGTAALVRELGEGVCARARELAVWLYTFADAKKRPDDAFVFNALDASWAGIQEQVARQSVGSQASF